MKTSFPLQTILQTSRSRFYSSQTHRSISRLQVALHNINVSPSSSISNSGLLPPQPRITGSNTFSHSSYSHSPFTKSFHTTPLRCNKDTKIASMSSSVSSLAPGNTALITGGASGIGFSFAEKCVKAGLNVILVDNNGDNLGAAQMYLSQLNGEGQVVGLNVDVGVEEEWESIKDVVEGDFDGTLHILFLNAGFSTRGSFATPSSSSYFSKILSVNLFGVINGINTLLPSITSHTNPSSIIITGSKQGITNPPGNPAYNASKAAVKTLAEHLSFDLREKKNIGVHLLVPGWTYTGLTGSGSPFIVNANEQDGKVEKAGLEKKPKGAWSADQVTGYLQEKMGEGKFYIVCPDGDVSEEMDRKRMAWGAGDIVQGRLPLSRWREEYRSEFEEFIKKDL